MGVDMSLEFMYAAPYSNLYTNIHLGAASEPFGWVVRGQVGACELGIRVSCAVQDVSGFNTFWGTCALILTSSQANSTPPTHIYRI